MTEGVTYRCVPCHRQAELSHPDVPICKECGERMVLVGSAEWIRLQMFAQGGKSDTDTEEAGRHV